MSSPVERTNVLRRYNQHLEATVYVMMHAKMVQEDNKKHKEQRKDLAQN